MVKRHEESRRALLGMLPRLRGDSHGINAGGAPVRIHAPMERREHTAPFQR